MVHKSRIFVASVLLVTLLLIFAGSIRPVNALTNTSLVLVNPSWGTNICCSMKQAYTFRAVVTSDFDFTEVRLTLDIGGQGIAVKAYYDAGDYHFSEVSDPNNYITLSGSFVMLGPPLAIQFDFGITFAWTYPDQNQHPCQLYSLDMNSNTDTDNYPNLYQVRNSLYPGSLAISSYHCNPSTSLTFGGFTYYVTTSVAPPNGDYNVKVMLGGVQQAIDHTTVAGAFSMQATSSASVGVYSYTAECDHLYSSNTFPDVIVDRIKVLDMTSGSARTGININVAVSAVLVFEYGVHTVDSGTITINGYSASYQGSGLWSATVTSSTVQLITFNNVAGSSEGITVVNQNGKSVAVIWDRMKVASYSVTKSHASTNENVNISATIRYEYDNALVTTGTITINSYSATNKGSGVYQITRTSTTVVAVTYNTVAGSESTYGCTSVNQNSQSAGVTWDRLDVTITPSILSPSPNQAVSFLVTAKYNYTGVSVSSFTVNTLRNSTHFALGTTFLDSANNGVTYNYTCENITEPLYGLTSFASNVVNISWSAITFSFVSSDPAYANKYFYLNCSVDNPDGIDKTVDVNITLTQGSIVSVFRWTSAGFVEVSDSTSSWLINATGCTTVNVSSTVRTFCFRLEFGWGLSDGTISTNASAYSSTGKQGYAGTLYNINVVSGIVVSSSIVDDSRIDPSTVITFNGTVYYNGTIIPPENTSGITIYLTLGGVQKNSTSVVNSLGNFSLSATAEMTVSLYQYVLYTHKYSPAIQNNTVNVIVDRIIVHLMTNTTNPANAETISSIITANYEYDNATIGSFSINIARNGTHFAAGNFTDSGTDYIYNYTTENVTETGYGLSTFTSNTLTVVWGSVFVECYQIDSNNTRVGIGENISILFHFRWAGNHSDVGDGQSKINGTLCDVLSGVANFSLVRYTVGKANYGVSWLNVSGITDFGQIPSNPEIIFDRLSVVLSPSSTSLPLSDPVTISWYVVREYDGSLVTNFTMDIMRNGVLMALGVTNNSILDFSTTSTSNTYEAGSVVDSVYGLSSFASNQVTVTWSSGGGGGGTGGGSQIPPTIPSPTVGEVDTAMFIRGLMIMFGVIGVAIIYGAWSTMRKGGV